MEEQKREILETEKPQLTMIEEARRLVERMEKANAERAKLIEKEEAIKAERLLSGETEAGKPAKQQETADEKWAREAKERYKGTGMCPV